MRIKLKEPDNKICGVRSIWTTRPNGFYTDPYHRYSGCLHLSNSGTFCSLFGKNLTVKSLRCKVRGVGNYISENIIRCESCIKRAKKDRKLKIYEFPETFLNSQKKGMLKHLNKISTNISGYWKYMKIKDNKNRVFFYDGPKDPKNMFKITVYHPFDFCCEQGSFCCLKDGLCETQRGDYDECLKEIDMLRETLEDYFSFGLAIKNFAAITRKRTRALKIIDALTKKVVAIDFNLLGFKI